MAGLLDTPSKPVPIPDEASRPFFAAARRGVLLLRRCHALRHLHVADRRHRHAAAAPLRALLLRRTRVGAGRGRGTLYSFALMHQVYDPASRTEVPYNLAVVELDEGVRMTTNVVGCANAELYIGMPLEVTFEHVSEEVAIPKFRRSS